MVKDPVCGMELDENTTMYMTKFEGKRYYFCSHNCISIFKKDPRRYVE